MAADEFLNRTPSQWAGRLSSENQLDRIAAVKALGVLDAVPELNEALTHSDAVIRYWAAVEIGRSGKPKEMTALEAALKDDNPSVRVAAAEAFCHLGQPEVGVPVLVEQLSHPLNAVRLGAISSLEAIGPQAAAAKAAIDKATKDSEGYVVRIASRLSEKFASPDTDK